MRVCLLSVCDKKANVLVTAGAVLLVLIFMIVLQEQVVAVMPSYGEVRTQLARHRAVRCLPVPNPLSIPDELRITLRGREVETGDVHQGERFLLHTGQGGRLLVFCSVVVLGSWSWSRGASRTCFCGLGLGLGRSGLGLGLDKKVLVWS